MQGEAYAWRGAVSALLLGLVVSLAPGLVACGGEEREEEAGAEAAQSTPSKEPTEAAGTTASGSAEAGAQISAAARQEAEQIFSTRCFTCHGKQGRGDGPASKGLSPQPRDLTDPQWQASVGDDHIERIILYGGAAVGRSPAMPGNPDLSGRPEVVAALVEHVRSLSRAESAKSE